MLATTALAMRIGAVLHADDQAAANDWQRRMLVAGLGASGLEMPDDWEALTEPERARRLAGAVAALG